MLDRNATLTILALIPVMFGGAVWHVAHAARWSMSPFFTPAVVLMVVAVRVLQERNRTGPADAFAAWKKWGGFFFISCAVILTAFQLLLVFVSLGPIPLPSFELLCRLLIAGYGFVVVVSGNRKPKLPPLGRRWPFLSLGRAGEGAILRLEGWLLVSFGLVTIVSALLVPIYLIAAVMVSLALAMLAAILARRRRLREQNFA